MTSISHVWDQFLAALAQQHGAAEGEWKSYALKWGWSLRVLRKKRTIVWLSPGIEEFEVLFMLGDKAVRAARESKLPRKSGDALAMAPRYPEGTGLRLIVKSPRSLAALKRLAAIKVAN